MAPAGLFKPKDLDTTAVQKAAEEIASSDAYRDRWIWDNMLLYLMIQKTNFLWVAQQESSSVPSKWDIPLQMICLNLINQRG